MQVSVPWNYVIALLLFIGLPLLALIRQKWINRQVKDAPEGTPYNVYTTEFDQVVRAAELPEQLASISPDADMGFLTFDQSAWKETVADAKSALQAMSGLPIPVSKAEWLSSRVAVTVLVDQSGSMKGEPIASTGAFLRQFVHMLIGRGVKTEVIGFTTAGWHGGFARRKWIEQGRPRRPGRLCALMHIIYKSFDEDELTESAWQQILNPDVLRENIDGEALEFAEARLLDRSESCRVLLLISDGAPVDDSTLNENGPSFLYRHLKGVIARIQSERKIELCAIGMNHSLSELYRASGRASDAASLTETAIRLVSDAAKTSASDTSASAPS